MEANKSSITNFNQYFFTGYDNDNQLFEITLTSISN